MRRFLIRANSVAQCAMLVYEFGFVLLVYTDNHRKVTHKPVLSKPGKTEKLSIKAVIKNKK